MLELLLPGSLPQPEPPPVAPPHYKLTKGADGQPDFPLRSSPSLSLMPVHQPLTLSALYFEAMLIVQR